ncbi:MiaA tRNA delta(2)-isopentenylpyrophosphate transferase [Candidatus Methylopumilus planktonicus]|uniref:tRNA (adenosine(37)-N6)-dimethylallyltransferase MiaA n=1 Tax=Candidatus Methylopumilus planktonicus TaxID=1581557 RepID=UPI003BEF4450
MAIDKPTIFFLMGPTASGKTSLAVELVKTFPFEIISVDSAQIYQDMDIGVAKPNQDILEKAPHHLINIMKPNESYSVAQFTQDALQRIDEILLRKRIPLLVGGTMMYFNALEKGINQMPATDDQFRKVIEEEARQVGWPKLYEKLKSVDKETAAKLSPNDAQRISRALEVFYSSGKPLSSYHQSENKDVFPFSVCKLGLMPSNRKILHQRIEFRVHEMIEAGLFEEVRSLLQKYPTLQSHMPSMRSVGYRQTLEYFNGGIEEKECIDKIIFATRQLAKRQMTWMRGMENLNLFDASNDNICNEAIAFVRARLS